MCYPRKVDKPRQQEHAEATRDALLGTARRLFAEQGYNATSTDEVASAARLTKGAVYHHFASKEGLFLAVVHALHEEVMAEVAGRAMTAPDVWSRAVAGVDAFLDACLRPDFRRVALEDGPAVLGWRRWRQIDERYGLGLVRAMVAELMDAGELAPGPVDLPARALMGALVEAAMTISDAEDQPTTRCEAGALLQGFLGSLRLSH